MKLFRSITALLTGVAVSPAFAAIQGSGEISTLVDGEASRSTQVSIGLSSFPEGADPPAEGSPAPLLSSLSDVGASLSLGVGVTENWPVELGGSISQIEIFNDSTLVRGAVSAEPGLTSQAMATYETRATLIGGTGTGWARAAMEVTYADATYDSVGGLATFSIAGEDSFANLRAPLAQFDLQGNPLPSYEANKATLESRVITLTVYSRPFQFTWGESFALGYGVTLESTGDWFDMVSDYTQTLTLSDGTTLESTIRSGARLASVELLAGDPQESGFELLLQGEGADYSLELTGQVPTLVRYSKDFPDCTNDCGGSGGVFVTGTSLTGGGKFGNTVTGLSSYSVSAVPEPESWALLLAGLGLTGWAAAPRRRRVLATLGG